MAGRPDPVTVCQPSVVSLRFGVTEACTSTSQGLSPSHLQIVYFLEDEETLRKVPSMLPLFTGSIKAPRIPVSIENEEVIFLVNTDAEVSVLPNTNEVSRFAVFRT